MIALDNYNGDGGAVELNGIYNQIAEVSIKVGSVSGSVGILNSSVSNLNSSVNLLSQSISTMTGGGGGGPYWVGDTFGNIAYNMTGSVSDLSFITGKDLTYNSNSLTVYDVNLSGIGSCLFQNNNLSISSDTVPYSYKSGNYSHSTLISMYREYSVDGCSVLSNTLLDGNIKFNGLDFIENSISGGLVNADAYVCINNTMSKCGDVNLSCFACLTNTFDQDSFIRLQGRNYNSNLFSSCNNIHANCLYFISNTISSVFNHSFNGYSYSYNTHRSCQKINIEASSMYNCGFTGDKNDIINAQYFNKNTFSGVQNLSLRAGINMISNSFTQSTTSRCYLNAFAGSTFSKNSINYPTGSVYITAPIVSSNTFSAASVLSINADSINDNKFSTITYLYANVPPNNLTNTTNVLNVLSGLYIDHSDGVYDSNLNLNTNITVPESRIFVRGINLIPYIRSLFSMISSTQG